VGRKNRTLIVCPALQGNHKEGIRREKNQKESLTGGLLERNKSSRKGKVRRHGSNTSKVSPETEIGKGKNISREVFTLVTRQRVGD